MKKSDVAGSKRRCSSVEGEWSKHTLSVKDAITAHERAKKTKIPRHIRVPLTGFKIVKTGTFQWLGSGSMGEVLPRKRSPSLSAIFFELCPQGVFDAVLENAYETRVKGAHRIKYEDLLHYFALRTFMHGTHGETLNDTYKLLRNEFGHQGMAHERFERVQRAWLCPQAVAALSLASENKILHTEVITIDEKLKPFTGETPYLRFVPNKDPQDGHWITETTVKAPKTGLPYLVNCFPVQQKEGPSMLDFYKIGLDWVAAADRPNTVVVTDAYYMDDASRNWLRSEGFMYLAAINPTRFKEVWEPLKLKVKKRGQVAVAWNKITGEAAVHCWTFENRKTFLLTNAFKFKSGPQKLTSEVFDVAYKHSFNTCDRLNHFIANKEYPIAVMVGRIVSMTSTSLLYYGTLMCYGMSCVKVMNVFHGKNSVPNSAMSCWKRINNKILLRKFPSV
jgi:hypothetical protein